MAFKAYHDLVSEGKEDVAKGLQHVLWSAQLLDEPKDTPMHDQEKMHVE